MMFHMHDNARRGRLLLPELSPSDVPVVSAGRPSGWRDRVLHRLWVLFCVGRRLCNDAWLSAEDAMFALPLSELAFMLAGVLFLLSGSR